jgi:predicted phosphodiesterase
MTTRFLYITDTHWGAQPNMGYTVQPRDPAIFEDIHLALKQWLARQPESIDLILHGGDVVNDGTEPQIIGAVSRLKSLGLPVHVCLGNHDLEQPSSITSWRKHHQGLLADVSGSYRLALKDLDLYVLAHHWDQIDPPHYWNRAGPQVPLLDSKQLQDFEDFARGAMRPIVLAVHAPVLGVPPSQSGQPEEVHKPAPTWRDTIFSLIDRCPAIALVLTGHNHMHTLARHRQAVIASTTSLTETPFQARVIEVNNNHFTMNTVQLCDLLTAPAPAILPAKAYAVGSDEQRFAQWTWSSMGQMSHLSMNNPG